MENNKLFKSKRWHEDVGAVSIGHEQSTKKEREDSKKEFTKILKEKGAK